MNSNKEANNMKPINTTDSSELSSDITEEKIDILKEGIQLSPIDFKEDSFIEENNLSKIMKEKRTRFHSENSDNFFIERKNGYGLKIKKICKHLKKLAKEELNNTKARKFSFS